MAYVDTIPSSAIAKHTKGNTVQRTRTDTAKAGTVIDLTQREPRIVTSSADPI